ncbi:hypothetical protein ACQP2X_06220 [Actinoplanes sp. CA-131856]
MPNGPAVRVVGHPGTTVVLRGADGPPEAVIAALPREEGRHTVIVASAPALGAEALAGVLAERLPVGCRSIRLVLSRAGHAGMAGVLAARLRLEVVAPRGTVTLLPDGRIFAAGGGWELFRPGQTPVRQGARHPAPAWEESLGDHPAFTAIPAGLWLHYDDEEKVPPALLAVPVDADQPTVVIGSPGGPIDDARAFEALETLARAVRRRLLLVPYGPDSARLHKVAERLATRDGATVEVLNGVPDAGAVLTTVDRAGHRGWRPFGERFRYRAGVSATVVAARPPGVELDGVAVEVVRAGLWLRGAAEVNDGAARRVPADALPLLVLGSEVTARPEELAGRVAAVAGLLPGMRLVVTVPPADTGSAVWRELTDAYGPLLVAVGDGELAPLPETGRGPSRSSDHDTPSPIDRATPPETERGELPQGQQGSLPGTGNELPGPAAGPLAVATVPGPVVMTGAVRLVAVDEAATDQEGAVAGPSGGEESRGVPVMARWLPPRAWVAGQVLATPGPSAAVAAHVAPGDAGVMVWSVSGRTRADATVEFGPGTLFRVLGVDGPAQVLLREVAADDGRSDDAVREALRRLAAARGRAAG